MVLHMEVFVDACRWRGRTAAGCCCGVSDRNCPDQDRSDARPRQGRLAAARFDRIEPDGAGVAFARACIRPAPEAV